jgi:Polyketide cyclase / dehydrase and lipid transport
MRSLLLVFLLPFFTPAFSQTTPMPPLPNPTDTHFHHTLTTTAPPERIWQLWTDVALWPRWDLGLKSASLEGTFQEGARGQLVPDKGLTSRFHIEAVTPGISYRMVIPLPLGSMRITRTLRQEGSQMHFTHEVQLTGLAKLYLRSEGKRYRAMLPSVLTKIKELAEAPADSLTKTAR